MQSINKIRVSTNKQNNRFKQIYQNSLKFGAKKHNVSINEAYFKNEEDDNPGNYSEEQAEVLCELLDNDSE